MQLATSGLIIIKDRRLLLALSKNKKCFYLPGGKIDNGETNTAALCREIREELSIDLAEDDLIYYAHITAPAFGEAPNVWMEQDCFLVKKSFIPLVSSEIEAIRYFNLREYQRLQRQAPGALMILQQLVNDNLVDYDD
jgi:8-oxo-dGTP pyrophosphatase MutT (NUDIX family)